VSAVGGRKKRNIHCDEEEEEEEEEATMKTRSRSVDATHKFEIRIAVLG
jgi:hypothetical protein